MGKSNNNKDFLIGSLVGGLIGAATALFLAPKTGKEVRENLGQQANVMKDRTGRFTSGAFEKSSGFANVAKEKTASLSQVVTEQSSQIMNKVRNITSTSKGETDFIEKEVADALVQISEDEPSTSPKDGQGDEHAISASIAEAVDAIENDEKKVLPQAQLGSEDQVKTNS